MSALVPDGSHHYKPSPRVALDQVYVAHYPHDAKYLALFKNGVRVVDANEKNLVKRAMTRNRILQNLLGEQRVKWISTDQYQRLPKNVEWSIELEKSMFGASSEADAATTDIMEATDDRFAIGLPQHTKILQAAEEAALEQDSSSDDDDDDNEDDANPPQATTKPDAKVEESSDGDTDSSSGSESDSDHDDEAARKRKMGGSRHQRGDSSSSDSSDDESDSSVEDTNHATPPTLTQPPEAFDDFLMPTASNTNETSAFEQAKQDAPNYKSFLARQV